MLHDMTHLADKALGVPVLIESLNSLVCDRVSET